MNILTPGVIPFALTGLALGSFGGCVAVRLPAGKTLWSRSACPHCNATLTVRDLVPVLSWCLSKGLCRHCYATISPQYTVIELASLAAFLIAWAISPSIGQAATLAMLIWSLLALTSIDLTSTYLPDGLTALVAILGAATALSNSNGGAVESALIAAALPAALMLGYQHLRGRDGMGWGDIKLFAAGGLWLTPYDVPFWWLIAGGSTTVAAIITNRRGSDRLPLGPGICLGLATLVLWQRV